MWSTWLLSPQLMLQIRPEFAQDVDPDIRRDGETKTAGSGAGRRCEVWHPGARDECGRACAADFGDSEGAPPIVTSCHEARNDRMLRAPKEPFLCRTLVFVVLVK